MPNWYLLSDSTTEKWAPAQAVRQIKLGRASTTNENASPFTQTGIDTKLYKVYELEVVLGLKFTKFTWNI